MDSRIIFILLGIFIFSNGKPLDDGPILVRDEDELQHLLKSLYKEGKFDISFSHHEDGPKSHHEDTARIVSHDDHSHLSHHHSAHSHKHSEPHRQHKHTTIEEHPSLTNIQTLNLILKKKPQSADDSEYDDELADLIGVRSEDGENTKGNSDQVINVLKELEKKLGDANQVRSNADRDDDDSDLIERCGRGGERCGRGRSNDPADDNVVKGTERCGRGGERCGRGRSNDPGDDNVIIGIERCGRGGERCGRGRSNDNADDNVVIGIERCGRGGERCGKRKKHSRSVDGVDVVVQNDNEVVGGSDEYDLSDQNYDSYQDIEELQKLNNIFRERRLPNGDAHIQDLIKAHSKKIKINDNLNAMVVDLSALEKKVGNPVKKQNNNDQSKVQLFRNVDVSKLLEDKNGDKEFISTQDILDSESKPLKAIVVDLNKADNGQAKQIKSLLKSIQLPVNKYTPVKASNKEKAQGESKIVAHSEGNNNVYVPKWLLDEVVAKTNLRGPEKKKSPLPLTAKQKERLLRALGLKGKSENRIFRRSADNDIGVPFHLQIEGLGQVES